MLVLRFPLSDRLDLVEVLIEKDRRPVVAAADRDREKAVRLLREIRHVTQRDQPAEQQGQNDEPREATAAG